MAERKAPSRRVQTQHPVPEAPTIDFLILADRAEAVNGKLYMLGGGWDQMGVVDFKQPVNLSVALGVMIPWNETNRDHVIDLHYEDSDGKRLKPPISLRLNMGRPPFAVSRQSFRAMIAVNDAVLLPTPGTYRVVATLAGGETRMTALHAQAVQIGQGSRR